MAPEAKEPEADVLRADKSGFPAMRRTGHQWRMIAWPSTGRPD
jgi:hypothetical protein